MSTSYYFFVLNAIMNASLALTRPIFELGIFSLHENGVEGKENPATLTWIVVKPKIKPIRFIFRYRVVGLVILKGDNGHQI